jgi:hypothetical protein
VLSQRHAGESRHPELTENTGFRVALRWNIIRRMLDEMTKMGIATQSRMPGARDLMIKKDNGKSQL